MVQLARYIFDFQLFLFFFFHFWQTGMSWNSISETKLAILSKLKNVLQNSKYQASKIGQFGFLPLTIIAILFRVVSMI